MNIKSMIRHSLAVFTEEALEKFRNKIINSDIPHDDKCIYLGQMAEKVTRKMEWMAKYDFREFCMANPHQGVFCDFLPFKVGERRRVIIQKSALIPGNFRAVNFITGELHTSMSIRTKTGKIIPFTHKTGLKNEAKGKPLFDFDPKEYAKVERKLPKEQTIKVPEAFVNGQKVRLKDIWDTPISQIKKLTIELLIYSTNKSK